MLTNRTTRLAPAVGLGGVFLILAPCCYAAAPAPSPAEAQYLQGQAAWEKGEESPDKKIPAGADVPVDAWAEPAAQVRLVRVGRLRGDPDEPVAELAAQGKYVYLATFTFRVVDVSEPSRPRVVGSCPVTNVSGTLALAVSGNHAYVTVSSDEGARLRVIDLSAPTAPRVVASHNLDGSNDVVVQGLYAYVTDGQRLLVIDVSQPTAPQEVGRCELGRTFGIAVATLWSAVTCHRFPGRVAPSRTSPSDGEARAGQ